MIYYVLVQFDVFFDKCEVFVVVGLFDVNGLLQNELGILCFEVICDENNCNCFYFDEVYEDEVVFFQYCCNEIIVCFYELIDSYVFGLFFLFKGYCVEG